MPSPPEDRTRELCAQALAAQNVNALDRVNPQLQAALKEYVDETHTRAAEVIPHTSSFPAVSPACRKRANTAATHIARHLYKKCGVEQRNCNRQAKRERLTR